MSLWDQLTPYHQVGLNAERVPVDGGSSMPGIARAAGPGLHEAHKAWHPDSPLFWVAGFIGVTMGLIAGSTQLRVGKFRVGASAGTP